MSKQCQINRRVVDMRQIARRGGVLTGNYDIADLPLLHDRLADRRGNVAFSLRPRHQRIDCADGSRKLLLIEVQLQATVTLLCQRTLLPFVYDLQAASSVILVPDEDSAATLPAGTADWPDEFEPMLADARALDVSSLLAEELLLALPLAPVAPDTEPVTVTVSAASPTAADSAASSKSPFAVLAGLMHDRSIGSGNLDHTRGKDDKND